MARTTLNIGNLNEMLEQVSVDVQAILADTEYIQKSYPVSDMFGMSDTHIAAIRQSMVDLQGTIAVYVLEISNISLLLLRLKRTSEGTPTIAQIMHRQYDEIRKELASLQSSLRLQHYFLKDELDYLKNCSGE